MVLATAGSSPIVRPALYLHEVNQRCTLLPFPHSPQRSLNKMLLSLAAAFGNVDQWRTKNFSTFLKCPQRNWSNGYHDRLPTELGWKKILSLLRKASLNKSRRTGFVLKVRSLYLSCGTLTVKWSLSSSWACYVLTRNEWSKAQKISCYA